MLNFTKKNKIFLFPKEPFVINVHDLHDGK
jgi:hypothetical protein